MKELIRNGATKLQDWQRKLASREESRNWKGFAAAGVLALIAIGSAVEWRGPIEPWAVGSYAGLIDSDPQNAALGGVIQITVGKQGNFSGSLRMGKSKESFRGQLTPGWGAYEGTVRLKSGLEVTVAIPPSGKLAASSAALTSTRL